MFDYSQLEALAAIARTGSLREAAIALAVTPSAISQRLKALEERVGAVLVERSSPARLTDMGARLVAHTEAVRLLERALVPDAGPPPILRIAVNADSLESWFLPALTALDGPLVEVIVEDETHSVELLRAGAVVAAITGQGAPVQGANAHPLGALPYLACCAPAFAARWFPQGLTADAAAHAPALSYSAKDRLQSRFLARELGAAVEPPAHRLPSTSGFLEAALLGLGWGMQPLPLARAALEDGRLVTLSPEPLRVVLTWQVSRALPALAPLTAAVLRAARAAFR